MLERDGTASSSRGHGPSNPRGFWACVATAGLMILAIAASAAEYPVRPIRFIVPSAPGGAPDINARLLAAELSKQLGQQVIVDNRAGAGGAIGLELIIKSPPDGYTLGYGTSAA